MHIQCLVESSVFLLWLSLSSFLLRHVYKDLTLLSSAGAINTSLCLSHLFAHQLPHPVCVSSNNHSILKLNHTCDLAYFLCGFWRLILIFFYYLTQQSEAVFKLSPDKIISARNKRRIWFDYTVEWSLKKKNTLSYSILLYHTVGKWRMSAWLWESSVK